jgi:hypothetical protein
MHGAWPWPLTSFRLNTEILSRVPATSCVGFGLRIESAIPVMGALPAEGLGYTQADLLIEHDCFVDTAPERSDGPYQWAGQALTFTQAGCARYRISGHRIGVLAFPGADGLELAQMLVATALPAALWYRGQVVLHAACAQLPGGRAAIALVGPSGIGKSTLLHQLFERGARIVGDDACTLSLDKESVYSQGLPGCLALRTNASDQRTYLRVPPERALPSARLAALVLIDVGPDPVTVGFQPLKGRQKLETLLQNRHRPRVPRLLQREGQNLPDIARMADRLPMYQWRRQQGNTPLRDDELDFLLKASL